MSDRKVKNGEKAYAGILSAIFKAHYKRGCSSLEFERDEIQRTARELGFSVPKNLGDVVYAFRYRRTLPAHIAKTAKPGFEWTIEGAGRGRYIMKQVRTGHISPRDDAFAIKIPDATPEIIGMYAQSDEQALLAKVRYNRLIDIFLGVTAYSLQNHLRTTVSGLGQIEIDEIYVAVDKAGIHYIVPVQAKTGKDRHSSVQTKQDIACCAAKFPHLVCRAVSAQFMKDDVIAMLELAIEGDEVKIAREHHYRLAPGNDVTPDDLALYKNHARRN